MVTAFRLQMCDVLYSFYAAPDTDKELKPDDACRILEEILDAQNQSSFFGLRLGLPVRVVEAIHSRYQEPKERLLHVIFKFLNQAEPRPTWRVIVNALRSPVVNLPRLAKTMEEAHFPQPTSTSFISSVDDVQRQVKRLNKRFSAIQEATIECLERSGIAVLVVSQQLISTRSSQRRNYTQLKTIMNSLVIWISTKVILQCHAIHWTNLLKP